MGLAPWRFTLLGDESTQVEAPNIKIRNNIEALKEKFRQAIELHSARANIRSQDISKENRRLDSLARLSEGNNQCTAIAYKDGEFLVTSNKLHVLKSDQKKSPQHVKAILPPISLNIRLNNGLKYTRRDYVILPQNAVPVIVCTHKL